MDCVNSYFGLRKCTTSEIPSWCRKCGGICTCTPRELVPTVHSVPVLVPTVPGSGLESHYPAFPGTGLASYGHRVRLEVRIGTIANLTNTDSIVNFVYNNDIYGRLGIIAAAGDQVKQEYDAKRSLEENHDKQLLITTAGNLPYKAIFHVHATHVLPSFSDNIHKVLKSADKQGMRSIAFPALKRTPANKEYIDRYLQEFYEYEERARPACLHLIDIICDCEEDEKYHDAQVVARGEHLTSREIPLVPQYECVSTEPPPFAGGNF